MMYPIEQNDNGWWFVWSMPVKHTTDGEHLAKGLKKYRTYEHASMVCSHYNYYRLRDNYYRLLERVK